MIIRHKLSGTVSLEIKHNGIVCDIDVPFVGTYYEESAKWYLANGDPGYPGEIEISIVPNFTKEQKEQIIKDNPDIANIFDLIEEALETWSNEECDYRKYILE